MGLGAAVLLRLTDSIPKNKNYKLCFDNYFTGIPLLTELKNEGILALGTLKNNRSYNCRLLSETQMKMHSRGEIASKISAEGDICVSRWLDNGIVTLASTFAWVEPIDQVTPWSESNKEHIKVDRPHSIAIYNEFQGGVDKIDFLISLYRISAKTKKWPLRFFFHFLDLALANSWLKYRDFELNMELLNHILDLLGFRDEVSRALTLAEVQTRPVGRPRFSTNPDKNEALAPISKKAKRVIICL